MKVQVTGPKIVEVIGLSEFIKEKTKYMEDPIIQANTDKLAQEQSSNPQEKSPDLDIALASSKANDGQLQNEDRSQKETETVQNSDQPKRNETNCEDNIPLDMSNQSTSDNSLYKNNTVESKNVTKNDQINKLPVKEETSNTQFFVANNIPEEETQSTKEIAWDIANPNSQQKDDQNSALSDSDSLGEGQSITKEGDTSTPNTDIETKSHRSGEDSDRSEERKDDTQKQGLSKLSVADFNKIRNLGKGSYAEVALVRKITTGKQYALKTIDEKFMKKEGKQYQVYVEKEVLKRLNHPNIIKLYSCFQEKNKLYFLLEYVPGGEFAEYLRANRKLPKEQIIFFSAEIISVLEYLHSNGIAHRDLKPENILLTAEGHLKVIDFGTARFLNAQVRTSELFKMKEEEDIADLPDGGYDKKSHRSTFVGTAQYVSPEMLEDSECGAPADLWALGCMIYQMETGNYPFFEVNEFLTFQKIKSVDLKYPDVL